MIRFHVFSNPMLKARIERDGYKCMLMESVEPRLRDAVAVTIRRPGEFERLHSYLNRLSDEHVVYVLLHPVCESMDGCIARRAALTSSDNEFLSHLILDDCVKRSCMDLGISKSGYYKMVKKLLGKLNLKSVEQLKAWALLHLSV